MKLKNEKQLFDLFLPSKDEVRTWTHKPYLDNEGKNVVATDGHVMILVTAKCCSGNYLKVENPIPRWIFRNRGTLFVADIKTAMSQLEQEPEYSTSITNEKCQECNGSGEVLVTYDAHTTDKFYDTMIECPICEGTGLVDKTHPHPTGRMKPKSDECLCIGGDKLYWEYIKKMLDVCEMLGVHEIEHAQQAQASEANMFCITEDVRIIIMPRLTGHCVQVEYINKTNE